MAFDNPGRLVPPDWKFQMAAPLEIGEVNIDFDVAEGIAGLMEAAVLSEAPRCPECRTLLPAHAMGCLTPEVQAGRMTPRQRQIKLLEAEEQRASAWSSEPAAERLDEAIAMAGAQGNRIDRLVVGTNAWKEISRALPNGAPLSSRVALSPAQGDLKYMGYPLQISADVAPDAVLAYRAPPPPSQGAGAWSTSFSARPSGHTVISGLTA